MPVVLLPLVLLPCSCLPQLQVSDRCEQRADCYQGERCAKGRCVPVGEVLSPDAGAGPLDGGVLEPFDAAGDVADRASAALADLGLADAGGTGDGALRDRAPR